MAGWDPEVEHLAERNRLVFLLALGESVLLLGGSAVDAGGPTVEIVLGLLLGFASLFALWWNYFAVGGPSTQGHRDGTDALRSGYAYAHALMVLGAILVAVSLELRLTQDMVTPALVAVAVGGPLIYLVGNVLYLRSRGGRGAVSRLGAAAALVIVGVVALLTRADLPVTALSSAVLGVTAGLAVATTVDARRVRRHGVTRSTEVHPHGGTRAHPAPRPGSGATKEWS